MIEFRHAQLPLALALVTSCGDRQPGPPAKAPPAPEALQAAVLFARALVAEEAGRSKEAEGLYDESLRSNAKGPGDRDLEFRARFNLGTLLLKGHRPDDARSHLDAATKLRPEEAAAWYNLGLCQAAAGRDTDAVYPLMQAVTLDPARAAARYNLGFVLWRAGRRDEAKMHLEIAASQDAALKASVDRLLGKTPPPAAVPAAPPSAAPAAVPAAPSSAPPGAAPPPQPSPPSSPPPPALPAAPAATTPR